MEHNPYQPPLVAAPTLEEEQQRKRGPRPAGIRVLSGIHLLAGLVFIAAAVFFAVEAVTGFSGIKIFTDDKNQAQVPFWFAIAVYGFYAMLGVSIGIGLWRGARWGWWLATVYYVWWVLDLVADIPHALLDAEELDGELIGRLLVGKLIHVAILMLLVPYFFKKSVRAFFGLRSLRIVPTLAVLVMISIVLIAGTTAIAYFQVGFER